MQETGLHITDGHHHYRVVKKGDGIKIRLVDTRANLISILKLTAKSSPLLPSRLFKKSLIFFCVFFFDFKQKDGISESLDSSESS